MKKSFILIIVIIILIYENAYSQMKNQWVVSDSMEYYQIIKTDNYSKCMGYYDKDNIAVLGIRGYKYILRNTTNGGTLWNTILEDTTKRTDDGNQELNLFAVSQPAPNKIILTGYFWEPYQVAGDTNKIFKPTGFFKYTEDYGKTWNSFVFDTNIFLKNLYMLDSLFGTAIYIKSGEYYLYITQDGLESYEIIDLPEFLQDVQQIICLSKQHFIITNDNYSENATYIYETTDKGKTWNILSTPKEDFISKIKFLNDSIGFILYYNDFYCTNDGGKSWLKYNSIEDYNYHDSYIDFDFADENNGLLLGVYVLFTSDGGKNWSKEQLPFKLYNWGSNAVISYPSKDTAFIGLSNYQIFRRTNNMIFKAPVIDLSEYTGRYSGLEGNKIQWEKIKEAGYYELIVYEEDNSGLNINIFADTIVMDTTFELPKLNYANNYVFSIRAFNDSISSEWSRTQWSVLTIPDSNTLPSPRIIYPGSKGLYPKNLTAYWTNDEPAESYDIKLYKNLQLDDPNYLVLEETYYQDTNIYISNLSADTNYYLNVRCRIKDKMSGWSVRVFTTSTQLSVGNDNQNIKNDMEIFPNPVNNNCHAKINCPLISLKDLKLYNYYGEEIKNFSFIINNYFGINTIDFNVCCLNNGTYFLVLHNKNKCYIGSFVIIR